MTRHEAIEWLNAIKEKYIHGGDDYYDRQRRFAIDWAILLLKKDAVPVVHGRWEWYEALVNPYALCSNCGCGLDKRDAMNFVYCPYCGAKMDGERKDNEKKAD